MYKAELSSPTNRRWRAGALLVAILVLVLAILPTNRALAQSTDSVVWDRYDVTIDVRSDGTMHITEYQEITFTGRFSSGFAVIPLAHVEDIDNVSIAVSSRDSNRPQEADYKTSSRYDADPGTYTYVKQSGDISIDYAFEPTSYSGSTRRTVVLEYDVIGGLRVYDDLDPANQQVWWYPITTDVTDIAPVRSSTVTVNLPESVPVSQTVAYPDNPETDGQSWVWKRTNLGQGDQIEVSLQFPPITSASQPFWQERVDQIAQEREQAKERSAWAGVLLLVAGLIASIGGGVAILALWFAKGRDPGIGLVAEYVPEPPDDLRPGAVGALVDEEFNSRDVVATVLDLAKRGVIKMDPTSDAANTSQYSFTLLDHKETLRNYERVVLDVIFGPNAPVNTVRPMPQVAGALAGRNDEIAAGYYKELVEHKYFPESPEKVRNRWGMIFKLIPFLIGGVVILIVIFAGAWSNFAFFPIAVGLLLMIVAGGLSRAMPRKTLAGAESAAKWKAFRKYLQDLDENKDVGDSRAIFEKYLPYAVALGLQEMWVHRFAYVNVAPPQWYGGTGGLFGDGNVVVIGGDGRRRQRRQGGGWIMIPNQPGTGGSGQPGGGSGGFDIPGLQEVSDSAGGGLQSGSDSFFDMLGTVAKAFGESSKSGSGSFGGRGGFGGFSGGGGRGGGFGGGGGGGGSRGFK